MWARRSEPLTARTVLESETRGQGGFPESHPRPPPNASLTTVSPASFDPSWIFDFVSPPVRLRYGLHPHLLIALFEGEKGDAVAGQIDFDAHLAALEVT